jgi:hypothetical protein
MGRAEAGARMTRSGLADGWNETVTAVAGQVYR